MDEKREQKLRKADSQVLDLRLVAIDLELGSLRGLTEADRLLLTEERMAIHRELQRRNIN